MTQRNAVDPVDQDEAEIIGNLAVQIQPLVLSDNPLPQSREDVYKLINGPAFWPRSFGKEDGHSLIYLPANSTLRLAPDDPELVLAINQKINQTRALLGINGIINRPLLPDDDVDIIVAAEAALARPQIKALITDGYGINSAEERADIFEQIAQIANQNGKLVFDSPPEVADQWISKVFFRDRAIKTHGPGIVPPGISLEDPTIDEILAAISEIGGKVIVKQNGAGGFGNLVIDDPTQAEEQLVEFRTNQLDPSSDWVSIEKWIDFDSSYCVTSFITDENIIAMEANQQVLIGTSFSGSISATELDPVDQEAIVDLLNPLFAEMQSQGIRGFSGIDVIISEPGQEDDVLLPSGLAVKLIECNPRLNGNNQEAIFRSLLTAREGLNIDDLAHLRVRNRAIAEANSPEEIQKIIATALGEVAVPLTTKSLQPGVIYFTLDTNTSPKGSVYDAVIFVTLNDKSARERLLVGLEQMKETGIINQ